MGFIFQRKNSVCSFTCASFGPIIAFRHSQQKLRFWARCHFACSMMQIITKTTKIIRNKWIEAIRISMSFIGDFLDLWWSFFHVTAYWKHWYWTWTNMLMAWYLKHWKNIENQCFQDSRYHRSNYFLLLKIFFAPCLRNFKQPGVHFWPNLETFWRTSPNLEFFFRKLVCQFLVLIIPYFTVKNKQHP